MTNRIESFVTVSLVGLALLLSAVVVRREILAGRTQAAARSEAMPARVAAWEPTPDEGTRIGPAAAPVLLVELFDLECPACRGFHMSLREVARKFPDKLAVTYVHLPLPQHRFAQPAARALDCAGAQGKFIELMDLFYAKQDSLGLKSWGSFANDAGVPDTLAVAVCARATTASARINKGLAYANRMSTMSTPTVILNGWKLAIPPSAQALEGMVDGFARGLVPFDTTDLR